MKKQILFFASFLIIVVATMIAMPTNVYAAIPEGMSDEFKAILNEDGDLVITDSSYGDEMNTIMDYLHKMLPVDSNYGFGINTYDEDTNVATITRNVWDDDTQSEVYTINVIFDEQFSDVFKRVYNGDNKIVITSSALSGQEVLVHTYCNYVSDETYEFRINLPNPDDNTVGVVYLYDRVDGFTNQLLEQHKVNISYEESYSTYFQNLTKDGNIVITDSGLDSKRDLLETFCWKFNNDNYSFSVWEANEDCSKATVVLYYFDEEYYFHYIEQHVVNVTFEERISDEFKTILNEEGNILITSSGLSDNRDLIMQYINLFDNGELSFSLYDINEDGSKCVISLDELRDDTWYIVEQHVVNVLYQEKYSDEFKKIFNKEEGKIVIRASRDYEKGDLIWEYCNAVSNDDVRFYSTDENEDYTQCVIYMESVGNASNGYYSKTLEQHVVDIVYDKTMSDEFKKYLNSDGKFVVNSIKPTTEEEAGCLLELIIMGNNSKNTFGYVAEDFSSLELTIIDSKGYPETHKVEISYNYDENSKKIADELVKNFPTDKEYFEVKDMELVNYWLNVDEEEIWGAGKLDNYSGELKSYVGYKNFNFMVDHRMGSDDEFFTLRGGIGLLQHNNTSYYVNPYICVLARHILYVPDNTASTKEALLAAVQKRVDEYAGEGKVKITAGEGSILEYYKNRPATAILELQAKLDAEKAKANPDQDIIEYYQSQIYWYEDGYQEYYDDYVLDSYYDEEGELYFLQSAEGGYWFVATINGENYEFIVVKDSNRMIKPTHKTVDLGTNIEISSTSTSVPLDTAIKAEKLTTGNAVYDEVVGILKEKATEAGKVEDNETFDLKLYSNSLGANITKLNDGTFEVKLPVPDKFKGKNADDLKVYYVYQNDNDKIHVYDVKFDGDYIVFITDHFSVYTLSEKLAFKNNEEANKPGDGQEDEPNKEDGKDVTTGDKESTDKNTNGDAPQTGDNVLLFVGLVFVSIVGIVVSLKVRNRKK